jgi:hypothetical protein
MNLNDVLGDKPVERPAVNDEPVTDVKPVEETAAAPSAVTEEAKPEQAAESAAQRDEKGRFKADEPKKADEPLPLAALLSERKRRQEAEAELLKLREGQPKTDFFADPAKATTEHVREAVSPLQQELLDLKVQLQRMKRPDFDEVMMIVLEKAQSDPLLKHQVDSAPDPLEFIYTEGKRLKELADVGGDITKYREKAVAEERAKFSELETRYKALQAEIEALKSSHDKRARVPQSLSDEQSATASAGTFAGPTPLKSILS